MQTDRVNCEAIEVQRPHEPLLSQLGGMKEARIYGEDLAADIALYKKGLLRWRDIEPGFVLWGPPGTGKTTFACALAATTSLPLVLGSYGRWSGAGNSNDIIAAMQATFAAASKNAPSILFIDELDSLPSRGSAGHNNSYFTPIVNTLLECADGSMRREGVIIIAACNDPTNLDPALIRPGRLERLIEITLPALEDIPDILKFHLSGSATNLDLTHIALSCIGKSGADIAQLVRRAERVARRNGKPIAASHFFEALEAAIKGFEPAEIGARAVNAAGHVVAALALDLSRDTNVSLYSENIPQLIASKWKASRLTKQRMSDLIVMALCGRAAEEVFIGVPTGLSGGDAKSDLAFASNLAFSAVMTLGIGSSDNLVWFGNYVPQAHATLFHPVCNEVDAMLKADYARAKVLMEENREVVRMAAEILMRQRVLTTKDLVSIARIMAPKAIGHSGAPQIEDK